ncbi:MAG: YlxR family protein [Eggerthellaceae bacterium]|jgi:predicted RNA-binding protein YlxR (DUF448 family)|nr:YlxR family protein [Eggerthellaceae bacterium]MDR2715547.1 YlxR family protein [Coriobacteriaceae bacterium]
MRKSAPTEKQQGMKRRRTCVACGRQADKAALLRLVRTGTGAVCFDGSGTQAGRGAYVCSGACLEAAYKARRIERALRVPLTQEDRDRIAEGLFGAALEA